MCEVSNPGTEINDATPLGYPPLNSDMWSAITTYYEPEYKPLPRRVSRKPVAVNNKQTLQRKIERFNREYSKYLKYMPAPYREAPPHNGWIIYTDNKTTPYKK